MMVNQLNGLVGSRIVIVCAQCGYTSISPVRAITSHEFQIFSLTHSLANHHSKTRSPFASASLVAFGRVTFHSLSVSSVPVVTSQLLA